MATVRICNDNQFAGTFGAAAVVAKLNLLLIATPFLHLEGRRARSAARPGPDGLAIQQYFCRRWRITAPDVPLNLHIHTIAVNFNKIVIVLSRLIDFYQSKFVIA
ncbi:hypothetical protein D3C76_1631450 [compost metagenome]